MLFEEIGLGRLENVPVYLILLMEKEVYRECTMCKLKGKCHRCYECRKYLHLA